MKSRDGLSALADLFAGTDSQPKQEMDSSHQRQGSRVRFAEEEEEPGLEVFEPAKDGEKAALRETGAEASAGTAPEVYWADDNDPEAAKYTFYREGTPTPPEYEDDHTHEKATLDHGRGSHGAVPIFAAAAAARAATARASLPTPPLDSTRGSVAESQDEEPSSRRKYRWGVLVVILLLIAIPIAIGVGVAVGLKNKSLASAGPAAAAASSSRFVPSSNVHMFPRVSRPSANPPASPLPTGANSTSPSSSNTIPSSSATPTKPTNTSSSTAPTVTAILPTLDCPAANNTVYTVPGMTITFLHVCGIDYSGTGGATDLSHVYTNSMAECMNLCASFSKCTGCGWGVVAGDIVGGTSHRCWMKNDLRVAHAARDDYCFGILQS